MKFTFFKAIVGVFLALGSVKAMDDEEISKFQKATTVQQDTNRRELPSLIPYKEDTNFGALPYDLLVTTFRFLCPNDLGRVARVSSSWKVITQDPALWRHMGSKYYGDYLSKEDLKENPKQKIVNHYLSVIVNGIENLDEIYRLVSSYYYQLNLYLPLFKLDEISRFILYYQLYVPLFKRYISPDFLTGLVTNLPSHEEFIAQGNQEIIKRNIEGFRKHGYEKSLELEREFNDSLVEKGYPRAVKSKISGLDYGNYGYEKDPSAVEAFLEPLVKKGNLEAIKAKIEGLLKGKYGYEKDPLAARELNELLVEKGDLEAIERKIKALSHGFGYAKDLVAARQLNEFFVAQGNPKAIQWKIEGLLKGQYGYEKDPIAAGELLNQFLVEKVNIWAIKRQITALKSGWDDHEQDAEIARELQELFSRDQQKLEGLLEGKYGYKKDLVAAREFNNFLIKKGDTQTIKRTIEELIYFHRISSTVKELNELLIENGDLEAIARKIEGLVEGKYGYEKNPAAARAFNDFLIKKGTPGAIKSKIIALSDAGSHDIGFHGYSATSNSVYVPTYGYEKDPVAARGINESLVERGDPEAIERKIKGLLGEATGSYSNRDGCYEIKLTYGYERNLIAAREFNDFLIEKGNPESIKRKIEGLTKGKYGYEKNPVMVGEFIESLVICEFPIARAIGKYIKAFAMKYGVAELGYERDRENAIRFIKENYVPY